MSNLLTYLFKLDLRQITSSTLSLEGVNTPEDSLPFRGSEASGKWPSSSSCGWEVLRGILSTSQKSWKIQAYCLHQWPQNTSLCWLFLFLSTYLLTRNMHPNPGLRLCFWGKPCREPGLSGVCSFVTEWIVSNQMIGWGPSTSEGDIIWT